MGICNSKPSYKPKENKPTAIASQDLIKICNSAKGSSITNLFRSLFKIASPIARRIISKILLDDHDILCDEKPVGKYKQNQPDESLPIKPIEINFNDVVVVDQECISKEKKQFPDFEWPGQNLDTASDDLIIFDLIDFDCCICLSKGIELSMPIPPMPFGVTGKLEIGANHESIQEASVRIQIPKLRVWYIHGDVQTLYVAFWGRPNITPNIDINADFGKGDCFNMEFTEAGSLDDVVEKILSGFAPKDFSVRAGDSTHGINNARQSSVGNRIGRACIQILSKFMNVGNGRPIVVELRDTIQPRIDMLLGKSNIIDVNSADEIKPRTIEEIKADMKLLELELKQVDKSSQPSLDHKTELKNNRVSCFDTLCC